MQKSKRSVEPVTELTVTIPVCDGFDAARAAFELAYFAHVYERHARCVSFGARFAQMDRNTFRRHLLASGVLNADP